MKAQDYHHRPISDYELPDSKPQPGLCPKCDRVSALLTIGVQRWAICIEHAMCWHVFSSRIADGTTEADWEANRERIRQYEIVQPNPCDLGRLTREVVAALAEAPSRIRPNRPAKVPQVEVPPRLPPPLPLPECGPPVCFSVDGQVIGVPLVGCGRVAAPIVSVVVPLYRSRHVILEQIERWPECDIPHEIIYVDDHCPLDSWKVVASAWRRRGIPRTVQVRVIRRRTNGGQPAAANGGAGVARASILAMLNADCFPHRGWLPRLVERLNDPTVGTVGSLLLRRIHGEMRIESAGSVWSWGSRSFEHIGGRRLSEALPGELTAGGRESITGCAIAIRSRLYWQVGGYDERFKVGYWDDADLTMRVRQAGYRIWFEPASCATHLVSHSGASNHPHKENNRSRFQQRWVDSGIVDGMVAIQRGYEPKMIIVRRDGANGDVLLAVSVCAGIKKRFPKAKIHFQTNCPHPVYRNPWIDGVLPTTIPLPQHDWLCDLNDAYERLPMEHMLVTYARIAGVNVSDCRPFIHAEPVETPLPERFVALHPGPAGSLQWKGRAWPMERFVKTVEALRGRGVDVVIVGSHKDECPFPCLDARGLSVHQSAYVIGQARMFAGIESFPHHMAMALNVPTVAIMGKVAPETIFYRDNASVLRLDLPCIGCLKRLRFPAIDIGRCDAGDEPCMKELT
jgi:GT2 family glycosyltransferase